MKKPLLVFIFIVASVFAFGQDDTNDSIARTNKTAHWAISSSFITESGLVGSYWKPTFMIAVDKYGYYCIVNLYNNTRYYNIEIDPLPHLYLKTVEGGIVDLEMDKFMPVVKTFQPGSYPLPGRYITSIVYVIQNVEEFVSNSYVKYRIWYGEEYKDVEIKGGQIKKFKKMINEAYTEANEKFNARNKSLNNPLDGF